MRSIFYISFVCLLLWVTGCNNADESAVQTKGSSRIYTVYEIWGDEEKEWVNCLFRFFEEDKEGASVLLEEPSSVALDGEVLAPDSARLSGAFYEVQKPAATFKGRHTITFKDENGATYEEEFTYQPLVLLTRLNEQVKRGDLILEIEGATPETQVRVLLMDTAFATPDINHMQAVADGRITITAAELGAIASGPVTLSLYKEEEKRVANPTLAGGRIAITYSLTRTFDLVD